MFIKYHWENVELNVPNGRHTKVVIRDVDYDFDVDITFEDICEYLQLNYTEQHAIDKFLDLVGWNSIDYDRLEKDEYFVEFMKNKYEDKAGEEFDESNEPY